MRWRWAASGPRRRCWPSMTWDVSCMHRQGERRANTAHTTTRWLPDGYGIGRCCEGEATHRTLETRTREVEASFCLIMRRTGSRVIRLLLIGTAGVSSRLPRARMLNVSSMHPNCCRGSTEEYAPNPASTARYSPHPGHRGFERHNSRSDGSGSDASRPPRRWSAVSACAASRLTAESGSASARSISGRPVASSISPSDITAASRTGHAGSRVA